MSLVAAAALLANLHGGGAYVELSLGSGWNDRVGLVSRGERLILEGGYFTGNYRGSYGFGTFWNIGAGFSYEPIYLIGARTSPDEPRENMLLEQFYHPHLVLGRGADLFRLAVSWKLRLGPIWSVDENVFLARDAAWGGAVSGEIAGYYNTGPVFSLGPQVGLGLMVDTERTAYQVSLGLGLRFQIPVVRVKTPKGQRADYWEDEY